SLLDLQRAVPCRRVGVRPLWTHADDVPAEAPALLLGQVDEGDHVGRFQVAVPRLVVEGVAQHLALSGSRARRDIEARTAWTDRAGRVEEARAIVALMDLQ